MPRPVARRLLTGVLAGALTAASVLTLGAAGPADGLGASSSRTSVAKVAKAKAANVVTPGDFTGYGFDQCHAPNQAQMDKWLQSSPFLAVGIYISGDSRACRDQPNLTPAWISAQLSKGWRLLPITLGPQASCQPRFPRYKDDVKIKPKLNKKGVYGKARKQGVAEATKTVAVAQKLGIAAGSTLWYDLEGYDNANTKCRESALSFLSGWTEQIRELGYLSGVYSSAGSGMLALDNARVNRPGVHTMPDQIWIARWDGVANTSTSYIRSDGWQPHARIKQYQGGHNETWGGVTINIDRNYLDVGRGSVAEPETYCGGVSLGFKVYDRLAPTTDGSTPLIGKTKALQCLLQQQGLYVGKLTGRFNKKTLAAANSWQVKHGMKAKPAWTKRNWVTLLAAGAGTPVVKFGSTGPAVRRVQRAINAAGTPAPLAITGVFNAATTTAVKTWQKRVGVEISGVVGDQSWAALKKGKR